MFLARRSRPAHRVGALIVATVLSSGALTALATSATLAAVPVPRAVVVQPVTIEPMPPYQPEKFCYPGGRPGTVAFGNLLTSTYAGSTVVSLSRTCGTDTSEHYDGRAVDWSANYKNAAQVAQVNALFAWLFAKDAAGHSHAMLRRLGIMYIIWNKQIWGTWSQKWEPYTCSGVTACHQDHVHFSLDWSGAMKLTSFWTGVVRAPMAPPSLLTSLTEKRVVTVGAIRTRVTTPFLLKAGLTYRILASGTYHHGPTDASLADAECSTSPSSSAWTALAPGETTTATGVRDLLVNRTLSTWRPTVTPGGGCNPTTHIYLMTLKPTATGPLIFSVNDPQRSDDTGALTVTVRRTA